MTREEERAYVKGWQETGRLLDAIRWREVSELDPLVAWQHAEELNGMTLDVPLPEIRRTSSGLIEQQALFHCLTR